MIKQIYIVLIVLLLFHQKSYAQINSPKDSIDSLGYPNTYNPYSRVDISDYYSFLQIYYDTVSARWFFYGLEDYTKNGKLLYSRDRPTTNQILDSIDVAIFSEGFDGSFSPRFRSGFGTQLMEFKAASFTEDSIYWFGGILMPSSLKYYFSPVIFVGPRTSNRSGIFDTVSIAKLISDVALVRGQPKWVLFANEVPASLRSSSPDNSFDQESPIYSYSYQLAYKNNTGRWRYHPVIYEIRKESNNSLSWLLGIIILILIASIAYLSVRNRQIGAKARNREKEISFENVLRLESDAPIDNKSQDELGFAPIYNAVTDIIKSPSKPRPLTIAVNGKWGSGKSSIMKIVQSELNANPQTRKQYVTAWFNAWHQEDESSLMNAFLLSIVHSYEQHSKFRLRIRIFMRRIFSLSLIKKIGFGLTFTLAVLVLVSLILLILDNSITGFPLHNNFYAERLQYLLSQFTSNDKTTEAKTRAIGGVLTAVLSMIFLNTESKSIGLAALKNLIVKNNFQLAAETKDPGFREQFRKEYWELLESLGGEKTLVVFIDDLDRVSGAKIFQQLEAINFISDIAARPLTSKQFSNTVFVLGMDSNRVAKALGYHILKEIKKPDDPDSEQAYLEEGYAYLQKMVQLTVPVPLNNK